MASQPLSGDATGRPGGDVLSGRQETGSYRCWRLGDKRIAGVAGRTRRTTVAPRAGPVSRAWRPDYPRLAARLLRAITYPAPDKWRGSIDGIVLFKVLLPPDVAWGLGAEVGNRKAAGIFLRRG